MNSKSIIELNENIKLADEARDLFNKREFKQCIDCLDRLNNAKSTQANKLISSYSIDKDARCYLDNLEKHSQEYLNELTFNQLTINDYNKALILSKQFGKFKQSIDLLESRINLIDQQQRTSAEQLDENVLSKIYLLLITIYMERKCKLKRALELLDRLNDKLADNRPKNYYYLKVRCYLANSDFINFRHYMDKLTNNEQFMISCYLESFGGIEQSISKLSTFNSLNNLHLKNNEALTKFPNDKVMALHDLNKIFTNLTPEVLYNLALMHFNTNNVQNALLIFRSLLKDFNTNPRLWSRIADCYLIKFKSSQLNPFKSSLEEVTKFIGENQQRKLILKPTIIKMNFENELKSARNCLLNSLVLIKQANPSFYPSNEPMGNELKKFKSSILTKLAYVNLCLNDYVLANYYADLNLTNDCSTNLLFIETILYKAESLIWLNRAGEAEQLIKKLENQLGGEAISEEYDDYINQCKRLDYINWDKKSLKYIIFQNLATYLAVQHKLPELQLLFDANQDFKNLQDNLTHLILLSIYKYVVSNNC